MLDAAVADDAQDAFALNSSLEFTPKCGLEAPERSSFDALECTMESNFCELVLDWGERTKQTEVILPDEPLAATDDDAASEESAARSPRAWKRSKNSSRSRSTKNSSASLGLAGVVLRRNARPNAMSTYVRRKTEMKELNSEAQELQVRLCALQQSSQMSRSDTSYELVPDSRWKELVKRQRQLRMHAEYENEQLRIAISDHTQMARSLDQVLRRRVQKATDLSVSIPHPPRWTDSESSSEERVIYGTLLMEACTMRADVDKIATSGVMDDTILNKVESSYSTAAYGSGRVCFRSVAHNVVEAKRSVLFTAKRIDNITFAGHRVDGLVIKERKWTILEDMGTDDCAVTRIQTFTIVEPGGSSLNASNWSKESLEKVFTPA